MHNDYLFTDAQKKLLHNYPNISVRKSRKVVGRFFIYDSRKAGHLNLDPVFLISKTSSQVFRIFDTVTNNIVGRATSLRNALKLVDELISNRPLYKVIEAPTPEEE